MRIIVINKGDTINLTYMITTQILNLGKQNQNTGKQIQITGKHDYNISLLLRDIVQRQEKIINALVVVRTQIIYNRTNTSQGKQCFKHYIRRHDWCLGEIISSSFLPINCRNTIFFSCNRNIFLNRNRTDMFKFTSTHRPKNFGLHNRIHRVSKEP